MLSAEELRKFEEDIKDVFLSGSIRAPVHLSGGNERQLIEIFKKVRPNDWVFSTHRSHYHAILKGVPPELVKSEILAGRSINLNFREYNFFTSALVGGICPIALGVAMAIRRSAENKTVWCFVGDMAAQTGIFYESKKYAKNFKLPIWFVIEDNGISVNTPTYESWGIDKCMSYDDDWECGGIIHYTYERVYPHVNAGAWVEFR